MRDIALIVDDDSLARWMLCCELRREYDVIHVGTFAQAVAALARTPGIAAVVSDLNLGEGPGGFEVLTEARVLEPACVRLLVTAGLMASEADRVVASGLAHEVVGKPWDEGEILLVLRKFRPARAPGGSPSGVAGGANGHAAD